MAILSAEIEEEGWVLRVRGTWGPSAEAFSKLFGVHPDFPLDPDGPLPAVRLMVGGVAGHDRVGGMAVFDGNRTRQLVATKPLRQPYVDGVLGSTNLVSRLDEVDHVDGSRSVRLALSDRVHAAEEVVAEFAPGWRSGEAGGTVAAANLSTRVPALPIIRWALPTFRLVQGTSLARVEMVVASLYPEHHGADLHQAVAAVRFVATDGVDQRVAWVTRPMLSDAMGDRLPVWGVDFDLAGLSPGVVTVHASVYPWVGAVRHTAAVDPALAIVHETGEVASVTLNTGAHQICFDPEGSRYAKRYCFLDPVAGSTTPLAAMVADSLEAARAIDATLKPRDVRTARVAMRMRAQELDAAAGGQWLPAANGFAGGGNAIDWWEIILPAGVSSWGSGTFTAASYGAREGRLVVRGDPADPDPQTNCIFRSGSASPDGINSHRWLFLDCTLELGGGALVRASSGRTIVWLDRVRVRGKPGFETATTAILNTAGAPFVLELTRTDWAGYGVGVSGTNQRCGLARACRSDRRFDALAVLGHEKIRNEALLATEQAAFGSWGADVRDWMWVNVRDLSNNGSFIAFAGQTAGLGTAASVTQRDGWAVVNSVTARAGAVTSGRHLKIGETEYFEARAWLVEGFVTLGDGLNVHNDTAVPKANLRHWGVMRLCSFDRHATKHDLFEGGDGALTGSWQALYGVGYHGNVHANRTLTGAVATFQHEWFGRGSLVFDSSVEGFDLKGSNAVGYADDRSVLGPLYPAVPTPGGGDYRPGPGSVLLDRTGVASFGWDIDGNARGPAPSAGAHEGMGHSIEAEVAAAPAGHGLWDSGGLIAAEAGLWTAASHHAATASQGTVVVETDGGPTSVGVMRVLMVGAEDRVRMVAPD